MELYYSQYSVITLLTRSKKPNAKMVTPDKHDTRKSRVWDAAWGMKCLAWEKGDTVSATSPMLPFKRGMRLIKCLGLPLDFTDEEATQFSEKGRFLKCILMTLGELHMKTIHTNCQKPCGMSYIEQGLQRCSP